MANDDYEGIQGSWQKFAQRWIETKDDPVASAEWRAEIMKEIFGKDWDWQNG